ncbi:hypothetical protein LZ31DRAFT_464004, partial [Colletotrichum somersetense]
YLTVSRGLWDWATSSGESSRPVTSELILRDRVDKGFHRDFVHVAIWGPAGSGTSSLVNALRGLPNSHHDAARVGTVEATVERTRYLGHSSFKPLLLYDIPGSETQRSPSEGYYDAQELYLFDALLILWGERLGEVEMNIIRACIRNHRRFYLVRSKSDDMIRHIKDDRDIEDTVEGSFEAKRAHMGSTVSALRDELHRAQVPDELIQELFGFCILANKNDLRVLSSTRHTGEWNPVERPTEIHERQLLILLGKRGAPPPESKAGSQA